MADAQVNYSGFVWYHRVLVPLWPQRRARGKSRGFLPADLLRYFRKKRHAPCPLQGRERQDAPAITAKTAGCPLNCATPTNAAATLRTMKESSSACRSEGWKSANGFCNHP